MNSATNIQCQVNQTNHTTCPNCWGYTEWNATFKNPQKRVDAFTSKMKGFIQTFTDKYLPRANSK